MSNCEIEQCPILKNLSTDDSEIAIVTITNFQLTYSIRKSTILNLKHINSPQQQDQQQPDNSEADLSNINMN